MYKNFIYSNDRLGINLNALLDENKNIWFIGKEVVNILGYKNTVSYTKYIKKYCYDDDYISLDKTQVQLRPALKKYVGQRGVIFINEYALYDLIINSKIEKALEFRKWVTREVLPSIRKNGYYIDNNNITQEQLDKLQKEKDELEIKLKEANELIDNELNADYFYTIREVREIFGLWEDEFSTDRLKEVSEKLNPPHKAIKR